MPDCNHCQRKNSISGIIYGKLSRASANLNGFDFSEPLVRLDSKTDLCRRRMRAAAEEVNSRRARCLK
jgi:hypothetical protein